MSDNPKKGLPSDHGANLFHHAKDEARRKKAGQPHHQPGLAREHAKRPLPEIPWARSEPQAPGKSGTINLDASRGGRTAQGNPPKRGTGNLSHVQVEREPSVPAGKSLFAPEAAPPKREVVHVSPTAPGNTAKKGVQRHKDRHEEGHGRVRSGRLANNAPLASELRAVEGKSKKPAGGKPAAPKKSAPKKSEAPNPSGPRLVDIDYRNGPLG